jgi:hypothetical protein
MAEQFDYKGYQVAIEVSPAGNEDWQANVYIRENEDSDVESFTVSPPDLTAGEARARAIRVAKDWIDQKRARNT